MTARNALSFAGLLAIMTVFGYIFIYRVLQRSDVDDSIRRTPAAVSTSVSAPSSPPKTVGMKAASPMKDQTATTRVAYEPIDDSDAAHGGSRFVYTGAWEHVKNLRDGRSFGTSSRAYRPGAKAFLSFSGDRLRIFGIKGPTGGDATVRIDGKPSATVSFFSAHKEPGVIVFATTTLSAGVHSVEIEVAQPSNGSTAHGYVNLDGAAISSH